MKNESLHKTDPDSKATKQDKRQKAKPQKTNKRQFSQQQQKNLHQDKTISYKESTS